MPLAARLVIPLDHGTNKAVDRNCPAQSFEIITEQPTPLTLTKPNSWSFNFTQPHACFTLGLGALCGVWVLHGRHLLRGQENRGTSVLSQGASGISMMKSTTLVGIVKLVMGGYRLNFMRAGLPECIRGGWLPKNIDAATETK